MIIIKSFILILVGSFAVGVDLNSKRGLDILDCGPQKCVRNYQEICAVFNGTYRVFDDSCALKAHLCENGERYQPVPMASCPPEALQYPRPCTGERDLVCATPNNVNYRLFKNRCELSRLQAVLRGVWWYTVPLKKCAKLRDFPRHMCSICIRPTNEPICAFNGQFYRTLQNLRVFHSAKCDRNSGYQRVSMIYC